MGIDTSSKYEPLDVLDVDVPQGVPAYVSFHVSQMGSGIGAAALQGALAPGAAW